MGMPSARISDMHVCPMVTGVVPHVGGPIMPPEVGGYHGSDLFAAGCRGGGYGNLCGASRFYRFGKHDCFN